MKQLLASLALVWGPSTAHRPVTRIEPVNLAALFSLPGESGGHQAGAAVQYEYGVNEGNTVIRLARQRYLQRNEPESWQFRAEAVVCQSWTAGPSFIEATLQRCGFTELNQNCLVVMQPESADCPVPLAVADSESFWLGRLLSMSLKLELQSARFARQNLIVRVWPFQARMVGLRVNPDSMFEQVVYMKGVDGSLDEHSVFVKPGSWSSKSASTLRLPGGDISVRFGNLIERGFGYEHVRLQIEAS